MLRQTTSLVLAFSGLVLLVTSVVLYLGPAAQVAHFCPWTFLGLGRHSWGVLHLNSGLLFCIAMLVHSWLNWKPLFRYLKRWRPAGSPVPLIISLMLTLYVCIGGYYELPPMKQYLGIARSCRMASIEQYGTPPYGSAAEYPAAKIAMYMGWDPQRSLARLTEQHIAVQSSKQTLADLARTNHTTIGHILDTMHSASNGGSNERQ